MSEISPLSGRVKFFLWYVVGTSLIGSCLVAALVLGMLTSDFGIVGVVVECYDDGIGAGMPALERVSASVGAFAAVVSQALKALYAARARKPYWNLALGYGTHRHFSVRKIACTELPVCLPNSVLAAVKIPEIDQD